MPWKARNTILILLARPLVCLSVQDLQLSHAFGPSACHGEDEEYGIRRQQDGLDSPDIAKFRRNHQERYVVVR